MFCETIGLFHTGLFHTLRCVSSRGFLLSALSLSASLWCNRLCSRGWAHHDGLPNLAWVSYPSSFLLNLVMDHNCWPNQNGWSPNQMLVGQSNGHFQSHPHRQSYARVPGKPQGAWVHYARRLIGHLIVTIGGRIIRVSIFSQRGELIRDTQTGTGGWQWRSKRPLILASM